MKKNVDYTLEYERILGKQKEPSVYLGPEEEARRIEKCTILESIEIEYSNTMEY